MTDEPERRGALLRLLRTHLRPYRGAIAIVVLLQLAQTFASLLLPALNADIINNGVVKGDADHILGSGAVMLAVTLVQVVGAAAAIYFAARTAMAVGRDIRASVFARVQTFSVRELGEFGAPSLITRTTNDVQQVQMVTMLALASMVTAPIMGVGGVIMALGQDVPLSALLVVVVPALALAMRLILRGMGPLAGFVQQRIDRVNRLLREQITGIRVVRAFVREDHERERFADANGELMGVALGVGKLMALMLPAIMLVMELSNAAVMWFGGQRVDAGAMPIGALFAFLHYLMQILMSTLMATFMVLQLPRARVSAGRIDEVLSTATSVTVAENAVTDLPRPGHVDVRGAGFRYPGAERPVLHDVDLIARPGQTTAVVGSTGSGKTTLLNLLPRLFDATEGEVRIGEVDVRELAPATLAGSIGFVPQKPYLFSGTIASNLRYGNPAATDEDLWHALDIAQARDFVAALPDGLDAPIGQGGSNVSGGQRQRLAIARALVAKPDIYLFDDSFSALDNSTDAALRAALARELGDATVVIVAQRISTIRDADRIVVLDGGRVVGTGTHSELMDTSDTYREIVLSQDTVGAK
ncbi:ABC transporter ATP-binding protein/permease [Allokutzneria sp. A3M-2-11 16]|uniref:ABC transporter ATP-binding protein n=1 Tax=Allokutzneria sp. A3M-2-11 16 TaxID=2962043 RepID=UPI0020B6F6FF|nr:ABC transporter ATP-binding protein [Allokutzneria sp. A3M-2-11 16]MCP3804405.1 ABC transporter ATP-binding protein/permease [Allokutzneria sp. A3M-2-11 16]